MPRTRSTIALLAVGLLTAGCEKKPEQVFPEELVIGRASGIDVQRGLFDTYMRYGVSLPDEPPTGDGGEAGGVGQEIFSDEVRSRLLDRFLLERAMVNEARAAGLTISETELDAFARANELGPLDEFLAGMPLTQREYLRTYLEDSLFLKKFLDEAVRAEVQVSDAEVEAFFAANADLFAQPERVRIRTLRVEALREARTLSRRVGKSRAKFEAAAAELATDDEEHGQDLGTWRLQDLPESFAEAIAKMEPGNVSGAVQDADGGFNLILLEERHPGHTPTFEEVHGTVRTILERRRRDEAVRRHVTLVEETAQVEVFPANLDFDYIRSERVPVRRHQAPVPAPAAPDSASAGGVN